MDNTSLFALLSALAGFILGTLIVALFMRHRLAAAAATAELWRNQLSIASDERTMFAERASRLPVLEQKLEQAQSSLDAAYLQGAQLREDIGRTQAELDAAQESCSLLREHASQEEKQRVLLDAKLVEAQVECSRLSTQLAAERQQASEKLELLLSAKETLGNQFKSLANDILEEKAKRFTEQNQTNLGLLLDPLKTRLQEFQAKVDTVYVQEGKDRSALAEQVKQLMTLNQTLSEDAKNLTSALKGSSKTQGNWGELVLERVLEASGLRRGEEYTVQESHSREDGSRFQPDVVIHLPEDRHLVVDAKMSLTAYEKYVSEESDSARPLFLKQHISSVREHIRELSAKKYEDLYGLKSLDFVLMFMPVEPAFTLAASHDKELFMDAWQKNVLLVSPSTLLFVVRTVAHLWRQEAQSNNAQEIAKRGAELYDKLVGFVEDLDSVGTRLKQAQETYDKAYNKFKTGRGNVIRQAQMLTELGIKPNKKLPQGMVEQAEESFLSNEAQAPLLPESL